MSSPQQGNRAATVLYAEDDDNDVHLFEIALKYSGLPWSLQVVRDGRVAMDYLAGNGPFADREIYPLPSLVLLDLNMPQFDGFEVLQWLRNQPELRSLPVVIYSASGILGDQVKARALGANDFIVKSGDFQALQELLHDLQRRWL